MTKEAVEHKNLLDLDKWMQKRGSKEDFESFIMLAFGLWGRRNKKNYEDVLIHSKDTIERALSIYRLYTECSMALVQKLSRVGAWQRPPKGFFKLNIDGALFFVAQETCIGAIMHGSRDDIRLAESIKETNVQDLKTVENC